MRPPWLLLTGRLLLLLSTHGAGVSDDRSDVAGHQQEEQRIAGNLEKLVRRELSRQSQGESMDHAVDPAFQVPILGPVPPRQILAAQAGGQASDHQPGAAPEARPDADIILGKMGPLAQQKGGAGHNPVPIYSSGSASSSAAASLPVSATSIVASTSTGTGASASTKKKNSSDTGATEGTSLSRTTADTNNEDETTTVDLATFTNSTITVGNPTPPSSSATPVPEATNFVLDEVSYQFLKIRANATSYVMGGLLPITSNGKPWLGGVQFVEAFKCQLNILNSNSRVLPVSFITYLIQNTDLLVSAAVKQAYLLLQKNVFMTVGPTTDDQIPPVAYLNAPEMLAFNSFDASSVLLANSTVYPSFFRTIPSDNFQARAMAETCRIFNWTFVAALFTSDSYGTSGRTAFLSQTGRQRIKVTCTNTIQPGSTSGLSSFADCVAGSDASVVLLWSKMSPSAVWTPTDPPSDHSG